MMVGRIAGENCAADEESSWLRRIEPLEACPHFVDDGTHPFLPKVKPKTDSRTNQHKRTYTPTQNQ